MCSILDRMCVKLWGTVRKRFKVIRRDGDESMTERDYLLVVVCVCVWYLWGNNFHVYFGIFSNKHNNLPSLYRLLLLYFERKD